MKIKVLTLVLDGRDGTSCRIFATEAEQNKYLADEIMLPSIDDNDNNEDSACRIRGLISQGEHDTAWQVWWDNIRNPEETFTFGNEEVDVVIPVESGRFPVRGFCTAEGDHGKRELCVEHWANSIKSDGYYANDAGAHFDWYNDRLQICVDDSIHEDPALHVRYKQDGSIAEIIVRDDLMAKVKIEGGPTTEWQQERDGKPDDLAQRFSQTCPDFQCAIGKIATVAGKTPLEVFALWRKYADAARDQSALVGEFIEHYAKDLGCEVSAIREAVYGKGEA